MKEQSRSIYQEKNLIIHLTADPLIEGAITSFMSVQKFSH